MPASGSSGCGSAGSRARRQRPPCSRTGSHRRAACFPCSPKGCGRLRPETTAAQSRSAGLLRSLSARRSLLPARFCAAVVEGWWRLVEVVGDGQGSRVLNPVGDEDVGLSLNLPVAGRGPAEGVALPPGQPGGLVLGG